MEIASWQLSCKSSFALHLCYAYTVRATASRTTLCCVSSNRTNMFPKLYYIQIFGDLKCFGSSPRRVITTPDNTPEHHLWTTLWFRSYWKQEGGEAKHQEAANGKLKVPFDRDFERFGAHERLFRNETRKMWERKRVILTCFTLAWFSSPVRVRAQLL